MEIAKQPFDRTPSYSLNKQNQQSPLQKTNNTPSEELKPSIIANQQPLDKEKVMTQIESMNKVLELNMTSLKFNLHEETDRYYVQVKDQETKEVIREIPTKEFLDLMAKITEFTGILIDKKI